MNEMRAHKLFWFFSTSSSMERVGPASVSKVSGKYAFNSVAAVLCALCVCVANGQTPNATNSTRDFLSQQPPIQVKSNLVLVPVFVFSRDGLGRPMNAEEERCYENYYASFSALSAEQPFSPRECDDRQVKDLALDDFLVFQDEQPQKADILGKESWWLSVRDNRTWHVETSDAPTGVWSSADLGRSLFPSESVFYYLLAYAPTHPEEGCHRIRVEVRRPGLRGFARDEYCAEQTSSDLLTGTKVGKRLEDELTKKGHGKIPLYVQAGVIRRGADRCLVDFVLEFPWNQLNHSWDARDGSFTARIGVLGAVYTSDGKIATRFSDLLWPSYWPAILHGVAGSISQTLALPSDNPDFGIRMVNQILSRWDPAWLPSRYETQLDLPPGEYSLRVVLSDGEKFGRAEAHLSIDSYDGNQFGLSSVLLCKRFRDAHVAAVETAAANLAPQYAPLVSKGVRVTPAGDTNFKTSEPLIPYFEIYAPQVAGEQAPSIQAHLRIVDTRNGGIAKDFPPVDAATYIQSGTAIIPIAREVPIAALPKGEYRLEVQATDSSGRSTPWRSANFTIVGEK